MKFLKQLIFKEKIIPFIISSFMVSACANVVNPTGGPKDVTPPKLVEEIPANKSLNFKAKKIEIEFDEIVQLKDQFKEITISPELSTTPQISAKKHIVVVKLSDTLQKNTTYSINFGNSIADVNESNVLKNYRYVFSTGNYIDSLKISGTVDYLIDTAKTKEVIVGIYPTEKEKLYTQKPIIYTSTTTGGHFELNNIKNGSYRIYAIKDLNGNKRFDEGELLGFLNSPINIQKDTSNIKLSLSKQVIHKLRVLDDKYYEGKIHIKLNYPDTSVKFNPIYPAEFKNNIKLEAPSMDSISLWLPTTKFDSTQIAVTQHGKPIDTVLIRNFTQDPKLQPLKITDNLKSQLIKPNDTIKLIFSRPLKEIDYTKIQVLEDSIRAVNYSIKPNFNNLREYIVTYKWDSTKRYDIIIKENQFTDIFDKKNAAYKRKFQVDSVANYGTISVNFTIPAEKQYIIQLLKSPNELVAEQVASRSEVYYFPVLLPDRYKIRYIEDRNKNGKWDNADVVNDIQPEIVNFYKDEIPIRAAWEMEINIIAN